MIATPHHDLGQDQVRPAGLSRWTTLACLLFALLTAVYPFTRAFFRVEVDYNEGWNIYNADRLVQHLPLYPVAYGWQTVNYPMLSFVLFAQLHKLSHEYLFTARVVSLLALLACCGLTGIIVRRLGGTLPAAWLSGLFALGIFCTNADTYVGTDDPQLLAQAFFLLGFFLYLGRRESYAALAGVAAIFVFAGSIKHNPLDFPLAVLLDLVLFSRRRTLWFSVVGLALAAASVAANIHFGGPFFVAQMLAPRIYSGVKLLKTAVIVLGPVLLPLVVAVAGATMLLRSKRQRVAAILLGSSLVVGAAFGGGVGVSVNTFFSAFFAIAIALGLLLTRLTEQPQALPAWGTRLNPNYAVASIFLWLVIPAMVAGIWNPVASLKRTQEDQTQFDREVATLRASPGPVLCESLLRCYAAGKPYLYDPFNATRLIAFGKLDAAPMLADLQQGRYSAVELEEPLSPDSQSAVSEERLPAAFADAIRRHYQPVMVDDDATIYVPVKVGLPK